jgi:pimeloyl-ACP methyl ester carboxylesterase
MQSKFFLALSPHGFHRVAYTQWGDPQNPRIAICVHGLTRNGRDFDDVARALEKDYRVVCPDVIGRGKSDWLDYKADYGYPLYVAQMGALISHLDTTSVDWVGTSMGGLIGMMIASLPRNPIRRLVINDIGPFVPKAALERLGMYVGQAPAFDDIDQLEAYVRKVAAPFGPLTDAQWRHLANYGNYRDPEGKLRLNYDPAISEPFRQPLNDIDLWPVWNALRCPVLVVHGADSDLLLSETVAQMKTRPQTESVDVAGVGHAPMLMDREQIEPIREFLLRA